MCNLALFNGGVIILMVAYADLLDMPVDAIIPLVLTLSRLYTGRAARDVHSGVSDRRRRSGKGRRSLVTQRRQSVNQQGNSIAYTIEKPVEGVILRQLG